MKVFKPNEYDVELSKEELDVLTKAENIIKELSTHISSNRCENFGIASYDGTEWHSIEEIYGAIVFLNSIRLIEKIG